MRADSNANHNSASKSPGIRPSIGLRVGEEAVWMRVRETVPVAFERSGAPTGAAPLAITAARFFGLDAVDWSMIFVGLALSALLLALA